MWLGDDEADAAAADDDDDEEEEEEEAEEEEEENLDRVNILIDQVKITCDKILADLVGRADKNLLLDAVRIRPSTTSFATAFLQSTLSDRPMVHPLPHICSYIHVHSPSKIGLQQFNS